jgi:hypothetical protein
MTLATAASSLEPEIREVTPLPSPAEQKERLQDLSGEQLEFLRERSKRDLYFLAKWVLQYDQVELKAHGALCNFMVNETSSRRMVLMPRGYLKSTICTIADSIRLSLIDPNTRILIQNEVFENAAGFLTEIGNHWESNLVLGRLFSDLKPARFSGPGSKWSKDKKAIVRTAGSKEQTYEAAGSGGSPQSRHYKHIKNDDLIGEKAKESEVEMQKSIRWTDGMRPLLDRLDDRMDFYGTRKTMSDVYAHLEEVYKSRIRVFCREPIEDGDSIFSKMPLQMLLDIQNDTPEVWAHDYMNNPIGKGGTDWNTGYLQFFTEGPDGRFYLQDPVRGLRSYDRRELDITITVDPNSGKLAAPDKCAVAVHGTTPDGHWLILESWSGRLQPDDLIQKIWDFASVWHPRCIGIEDAGQQNTLYYFEKKCRLEGTFYFLRPLKHQNKFKEQRIRQALDTPLKNKRLYLRPTQIVLSAQVKLFPQLARHNWDEIDCASYGVDINQNGVSLEEIQEQEEAVEKLLSSRGITGYGPSIDEEVA